MRYYRPFRVVIPHSEAGHLRVTHPFATLLAPCGAFAFDLHVLGTPPALILSQDQTLMFNCLALPEGRANHQHEKPIALALTLFITSLLSSCEWFIARARPKPEPRPLQSAMPPADNSTGFCACTLYLVFKEPTRTGPESRSRWPSPFLTVFRG